MNALQNPQKPASTSSSATASAATTSGPKLTPTETAYVRELLIIFVEILVLSFHYYFVYFINSTYLRSLLSQDAVGWLFAIGAFFNVLILLAAPHIQRAKGNFKFTVWLTLIEFVAVIGLATTRSVPLVILFFLIYQSVATVIFYCLDIFIEKYSSNDRKGGIRGIALTMSNLPPVITPFVAGLIISNSSTSFWEIYLVSAAFLIPFLLFLFNYFKGFKDPEYPVLKVREAVASFYKDKNIYDVFVDRFLLNFFYCWMVIYMPIYLIQYVGFSWQQIGIMFSIALLPFIMFQIPAGRLQDKLHDEKQILILGFSIMAAATMLIPYIGGANFVMWTAVLFITRIGACLVEVSSESYFFKHVSPSNAGFMSFYRMTRMLPFIIVPAVVQICLTFLDYRYTFLVLGAISFIGVRYAVLLKE